MDHEQPAPRRPRSAFEDLRRAVMVRLRDLGFRTTGGVARLTADGNAGVVQFQKSAASTPDATTFTVQVGIVLGALLPPGSAKPLAHCSDKECHTLARIGHLRDPASDLWWTLPVDRPDPAVLADVLGRVERDAVPYLQRFLAAGALAAHLESSPAPGMTESQRQNLRRRLASSRPQGGPAAAS